MPKGTPQYVALEDSEAPKERSGIHIKKSMLLVFSFVFFLIFISPVMFVQAMLRRMPAQINIIFNMPSEDITESVANGLLSNADIDILDALLLQQQQQQQQPEMPPRLRPSTNNNMIGPLRYPVEVFARGNRTQFAMETMKNGFLFVVALGKDGQLWHSYQEAPSGYWKRWAPLTSVCPNATDVQRPCSFDADPAIGKNIDGRLEIFARFEDNLDLWQMYQISADDPTKWTTPREGSCVDEDQDTAVWHCLKPGLPLKQTYDNYWIIESPVFPTSDVTVLRNETSGKLQVYFRNFEGHLYVVEQLEASNSNKYAVPRIVASDLTFI